MKGTRLPEDWILPKEWADWALGERPDLDPQKTAEIFRDYWISKPGQGGTKLNWHATWRNWVRRQKIYEKPANKPQSHKLAEPRRCTTQQWQRSKDLAVKHMAQLKAIAGKHR